ncbi:hypothetical protein CDAR_226131 [Caerostris darwini]|uniref:Uncharacterized protein n=1 Tax=Caerostris darwini TaxID=1538125 RepID=A0AAV4ULG2_9ARAC|nr:hypothetical protein CDAR_226131 [Caerostris darwini]
MGGKKGGGGHSGVEAMLVAGILAKLLGGNEKSSGGSHPMYIPVPMVYHSMGGYGMGGHPMSGGYSMGGHDEGNEELKAVGNKELKDKGNGELKDEGNELKDVGNEELKDE